MLLNPSAHQVRKATRYLLSGLIHCGGCGAALFSRPRNDTRRYLCAGRRAGHQPGIIADPVDELVKEFRVSESFGGLPDGGADWLGPSA